MSPQQADGFFYQSDMKIREKGKFFVNRSVPENFQWENFLGQVPTESLRTQDSENVYERWVQQIFDPVLPARSWEMPVKCELPAKIGRCSKKLAGHNFDQIFIFVKNFLSGGFRSKVKIVTAGLFPTPPYFCWQLAFYRHLPTSGRQNTVKTAPQPLIVNSAFFTLYVGIILPIGPIPISLFVFDLEAED